MPKTPSKVHMYDMVKIDLIVIAVFYITILTIKITLSNVANVYKQVYILFRCLTCIRDDQYILHTLGSFCIINVTLQLN